MEAYLVGLLEEAPRLPALLGWVKLSPDSDKPGRHHPALPEQLASHWCLPEFLRSFLMEAERSPWQAVLRDARLWATGRQRVLGRTA